MSKPDLLKILEHFGAQVQPGRNSQLVRCIGHDENRPSMSVNLAKGVVNCMVCDMRGDVYSIVEKKEGLTHGAARQRAAEIAGVPAPLPAGGGRPGLSGSPRSGRGGWKPVTRRSPLKPREG